MQIRPVENSSLKYTFYRLESYSLKILKHTDSRINCPTIPYLCFHLMRSTFFHHLPSTETAFGIKLTEVRVPKHTVKDHPVRLECHYEMEGDALYAVKWYKDGHEFYRFVPRDDPPIQVFDQKGINVDVSNPQPHIHTNWNDVLMIMMMRIIFPSISVPSVYSGPE